MDLELSDLDRPGSEALQLPEPTAAPGPNNGAAGGPADM